MLTRVFTAAGLAVAIASSAYAYDPPALISEDAAAKFCAKGSVVWFDPVERVFYDKGAPSYGKTKGGGLTCRPYAQREGYRRGASVEAARNASTAPAATADPLRGI
jgi:hypothetical protein